MAKGRVSSADAVLAAMVKDYKRLRRSLMESSGDDPEVKQLLERKKALAAELREIRAKIKSVKKSPKKKLAAAEERALGSLRESITALSKQLDIPVELD